MLHTKTIFYAEKNMVCPFLSVSKTCTFILKVGPEFYIPGVKTAFTGRY